MLWSVRHTLLLKEHLPITESFEQRFAFSVIQKKNSSDMSNQYMVSVRSNFDHLQETTERHTPNDEYENFVSAHREAAEWLPTKPRAKCRVLWESIAVREKRDSMKKASLSNKWSHKKKQCAETKGGPDRTN